MSSASRRMPIGLNSAQDLFAKVKRDAELLEQAVTPDRLFNFVVSAHALNDWVQNDPKTPESAREEGRRLLRESQWLKACRDLANGNKHFAIDRYEPLVDHADAVSGYGTGRYGTGDYGEGEWTIAVSWDGRRHDARSFAQVVTQTWEVFFGRNVPPDSRDE